MGGKKKHVDDGAKQSKTSRASSLKKGGGKEAAFIAAAPEHMNRFISLNGGRNAYLLDPRDGRTYHLEVGSEKWARIVGALLVSEHSARINAELIANGWEDVLVLASGDAA